MNNIESSLNQNPFNRQQKQYILTTRQEIELQEQLLTNDREAIHNLNDHAWESDNDEEMK